MIYIFGHRYLIDVDRFFVFLFCALRREWLQKARSHSYQKCFCPSPVSFADDSLFAPFFRRLAIL